MRLIIFGGTGSGKTTLAKHLSKKLKIPYYTTDQMVYKHPKSYKEKYSQKEKEQNLITVSKKKNFILEGVHSAEWIEPAVKKADLIIILDYPRRVLFYRVLKRTLKEKRALSLPILLYYSYLYKIDNKIQHLNYLKKYKKKNILIKTNKELKTFLQNILKT